MEQKIFNEVKDVLTWPQKVAFWFYDEIRWVLRVLISAGERFYWDNGFGKAASLAYSFLLSIIPFFAVGLASLNIFTFSQQYIGQLESFFIYKFVPAPSAAEQILLYLDQVREKISAATVPMAVFFIVTSVLLINAIEAALNETWQVHEPRTLIHRLGIFCTIICMAPVLALSVYVFISLRIEPLLVGMESGLVNNFYNFLIPFFLVFIAFLGLYFLVPKAPVKFASATFGAFITAVAFVAAYAGFAYYVERSSYNALYGAIATIPIFLFWLYVFWSIVLLGAETTYQAQHLPRTGKIWKRSIHSVGDANLLLGIQALLIVTKAFQAGEKMPGDLEIAEKLGCSFLVLKPALDSMESAGIISRGATRERPITLMRSPEKIGLSEIHQVLFKGREGVCFPAEMSRLYSHFSEPSKLEKSSLLDLV